MNNPKLTPERLLRKAIVYIRQSKPSQLIHNQESTRLQLSLGGRARSLGFQRIIVIDDDLGRTGSGLVDRPGFQRLAAEVCSGEVGAVFCVEASRLARNGRDWHHLIELCGMVGAVVVDLDGIYDPTLTNDRLLLGMKGTISEFEVNLFRQRSTEAILQKVRRGELQIQTPVGFCWAPSGKLERDPDQRVQQAIQLVFRKMTELGSVRQVLRWFREENILLPAFPHELGERKMIWKLPGYASLHSMLTNPIYAGAYVYGKTETQTRMVEGRARKSAGHRKPQSGWKVLIKDHHPGYLSWEEYERNQSMIAANAHIHSGAEPKAGRGGAALLSGLLRCRRCGRMIHVFYPGTVIRYVCNAGRAQYGESTCISFGGWRVDEAVSNEVLQAVSGNALQAALEAAEQIQQKRQDLRKAINLELEQARYEARLAARRYESVDPEQRLVAAELEARWNTALQKTKELEGKLQKFDDESQSAPAPNKEVLLSLAQDLPAIWNSPSTDMRLKQRIVRILIREIIADVEEKSREVVLVIHWAGGRHSELRVKKSETGRSRRCTDPEAIEVLRQMAGKFSDQQIATTLNRLRVRTGMGNAWNVMRVRSARNYYQLPAFAQNDQPTEVTLQVAASRLNVSQSIVRRMIEEKILPASQVVVCAPWQIPVEALDSAAIRNEATNIKNRPRVPLSQSVEGQQSMFSER
ncbi:MAG TPA: recombinase family protein [Chthoniobacterales bacterium]|nr:recombinase family protein [Chthoniobacterales bacterium]